MLNFINGDEGERPDLHPVDAQPVSCESIDGMGRVRSGGGTKCNALPSLVYNRGGPLA